MPSENSVQKRSCVLAVWDLFTVGRGTDRKKINLGQEWAVKERGGAKRGRKESVQGSSSVGPRQGPRVPPSVICLHTQKISDNFTAPLSVAIEKGQIPSWLLTLYPVSGCYHGKIQTFGILSGLPLCVVL